MPIFKNKVLAGNQFTGLTATDGLFVPKTGATSIQIRINSLTFHTGLSTVFSITQVDPDDAANMTLVLADTKADVYLTNLLLPTSDVTSWGIKFTTIGMTGDGWLTIDYDFAVTEGA